MPIQQAAASTPSRDLTPADTSLHDSVRTLYEDEHLLAVDKPAGLVVHPAYRHPDGTLYDLVVRRQREAGTQHLWLLHRLDRDTSGVVLLAKTELARRSLVAQFERHQVSKWYLALAAGQVRSVHGIIDQPLRRDPGDRRRVIVDAAGRPAITEYWVVAEDEQTSLLLMLPQTGRTHQIRAHLAWLGHPLIGDATYACLARVGAPELRGASRKMLHAWRVRFRHPEGGAHIEIHAPVPADLRALLAVQWLARAEAALSASAP